MASKICILDDDPAFLQAMRAALVEGYEVVVVSTVADFRRTFAPRLFDLVVLDVRLETAKEGLEVLRDIHRTDPYQPVVVATAFADTETYLETLQSGALMYVDKSRHAPATLALLFDAVIQQGRLEREQAATSRALERMDPIEIVGASESVRLLRSQIDSVAEKEPRIVVISGETGTGRELTARNLHARRFKGMSPPLTTLPRQTVPALDTLQALIGQKRIIGSIRGLLDEAHGSGLAVRCADELPRSVLEFLIGVQAEEKFQPVGSEVFHPLNTTIYLICKEMEGIFSIAGKGRTEAIYVPPLRDRKDDLPVLASYMLEIQRNRGRGGTHALAPTAMSALLAHNWAGNVAELRIVLEYGALRAMADGSKAICPEHLPLTLGKAARSSRDRRWDLEYQEAFLHVEVVEAAIEELATTNKTKLSGFLHVQTPTTLTRRIERAMERYPELKIQFPKAAGAFARLEANHS